MRTQSDWRPKDLTMMTPEQGESYERTLLRERPKYIPMEPEELAKLSPVSEVDDINFFVDDVVSLKK